MQCALPLAAENRLLIAHAALLAAFGPVAPACYRLDPVSQMILVILSGRTRDVVAAEAFEALAKELERWEDLADIGPAVLEGLIAEVTFAERKAITIPAAIREIIRRRSRLDLNFLASWPIEAAQAWLETLTGVGPKASATILNSSTLHRRVLAVDTIHNRVAQRLRLVPETADIGRSIRLLNRQIPDEWTADDTEIHHVLMHDLGARFCAAAAPSCPDCPLSRLCPSASGRSAP